MCNSLSLRQYPEMLLICMRTNIMHPFGSPSDKLFYPLRFFCSDNTVYSVVRVKASFEFNALLNINHFLNIM